MPGASYKYPALFFDIETGALPLDLLTKTAPEFDILSVKMGNLKDKAKIKEKLIKAKEEFYHRHFEQAALNALTGEVLAIGVMGVEQEACVILHQADTTDEAAVLGDFWNFYNGYTPLIGFNIFKFDLPFLIQRSWTLGVQVPRRVRKGRFYCHSFVDLLQEWQMGDWHNYVSLDRLAQCLGVGKKTSLGKDFQDLFVKDRSLALDYLRNDLRLTRAIGIKMGIPAPIDTGRKPSSGDSSAA